MVIAPRIGVGVSVGAASLLALGCSSILGIDTPPLIDSLDGPGGCALDDPAPCRAECPHAFCEDFEDGALSFPRWSPPAGVVDPVRIGNASVSFVQPGAASMRSLSTTLDSGGALRGALLLHRLDPVSLGAPAPLAGIRIAAAVRVERWSADASASAGGDTSTQVFALVNGRTTFSGPLLTLSDHAASLSVTSDLLAGSRAPASSTLANADVATSLGSWTRASLFAGTPARARALGFSACPDAPYVFAASWGASEVCTRAPDGATLAALSTDCMLVVGPLASGSGELEIRYDDVRVDAYAAR